MGWGSKRTQSGRASDHIENVLGKSLRVRGDMKAEGAFRVDGTVDGAVESTAAVVIGESGAVNGDVSGTDIVVAGKVHSRVVARGHLDITATGVVEGDIDAKSFRIEVGGVFRGTSRMGGAPPSTPEGARPTEDAKMLSLAHLAAMK